MALLGVENADELNVNRAINAKIRDKVFRSKKWRGSLFICLNPLQSNAIDLIL